MKQNAVVTCSPASKQLTLTVFRQEALSHVVLLSDLLDKWAIWELYFSFTGTNIHYISLAACIKQFNVTS